MRSFLAAVAGIVSAGIAIWLFEFLGHVIFPLQIEIDPTDMESIREMMFKIPITNLVAVILAHGIGLIVGLFIARIIDKKTSGPLYGVAGIIFLMTLINLLLIPHPMWFMIADLGVILIVAFAFIATRKKAA